MVLRSIRKIDVPVKWASSRFKASDYYMNYYMEKAKFIWSRPSLLSPMPSLEAAHATAGCVKPDEREAERIVPLLR